MNKHYTSRRTQTGLSLIELMIAALLSLILIGGVIQIFSSTSSTFRFTENTARAQENGRFATDILARYIRMGGYSTSETADERPIAIVAPGCATNACVADNIGPNNSDRIAIQLDAPDDRDCNNNVLVQNRVITNVFWIAADATNNNVSTLFCRGFNNATSTWLGAAQPFIAGIDSMQFLYGISEGGDSITRFVNASNVSDWNDVHAVKVAVLAQSGLDDRAQAAARNYVLLDNAPININDGRNRLVFSTTVFISNSY